LLRATCLLALLALIPVLSICAQPAHPRLYFDSGSIDQIRMRVVSDEKSKAGWDEFFRTAYTETGNKEWNSTVCERLAFAYMLIGVEDIGKAAKEMLLQAIQMPSWHDGNRSDRASFPWHSGLRTSELCMTVATAYDWIYPLLSESERETVRSALIEKGILPLIQDWSQPGSRIHTLDSMGHNWWAVCLAGAGVGVLSVMDEDPRAGEWERDITQSLVDWLRYQGNPLLNKVPNFGLDGGFYEGLNYADYSLRCLFRYAEALQHVTGRDILTDNPVLKYMGLFYLYTAYPSSEGWWSVNFGDSPSRFVPGNSVLLNLARRMQDPYTLWHWNQVYGRPSDPFGFLWMPSNMPPKAPDDLPPSRLFEGIDWAIVRDGWAPDGNLFALTCGDYWNHTHADEGSFILYSGGKPLVIDSGCCEYSKDEYVSYFVQSEAHNVVLWENQGQPKEDRYRGSAVRGEIHGWVSSPHYTYFYADATGAYASILLRNFRHVIAMDGVYVLVDDLRAYKPGVFSWLLHPEGKFDLRTQSVTIANDPAAADLHFAFPKNLQSEKRSGMEETTAKSKPYLAFKTKESAEDIKFLSVLSTRKSSDRPAAPPEPLEGSNWIGMRFDCRDGKAELYCNLLADGRKMHDNSENNMAGFVTDAFLVLAARDSQGKIIRLGVHNGSFLRDGSGSIFESFTKSDLVYEIGSNQIDASARTQAGSRILLRSPRPAAVVLDGTTVTDSLWRESVSMQEIALPAGSGRIGIRW